MNKIALLAALCCMVNISFASQTKYQQMTDAFNKLKKQADDIKKIDTEIQGAQTADAQTSFFNVAARFELQGKISQLQEQKTGLVNKYALAVIGMCGLQQSVQQELDARQQLLDAEKKQLDQREQALQAQVRQRPTEDGSSDAHTENTSATDNNPLNGRIQELLAENRNLKKQLSPRIFQAVAVGGGFGAVIVASVLFFKAVQAMVKKMKAPVKQLSPEMNLATDATLLDSGKIS